MKLIKSIIFDFDNTIAKNTEPTDSEIFKLVKKWHRTIDDSVLMETIQESTTDHQICQNVVPEIHRESVYEEILKINLKNATKVYYSPEIIKAISYLGNNYQLHIISGRDKYSLIYSLKEYKIYNNFTEIIGGDSGFAPKPSPSAFQYIINKYKMAPSEIIYIGDAKTDFLMSKKIGCHFIGAFWYNENTIGKNIISCNNLSFLLKTVCSFGYEKSNFT